MGDKSIMKGTHGVRRPVQGQRSLARGQVLLGFFVS
jgi:hypothetical protein